MTTSLPHCQNYFISFNTLKHKNRGLSRQGRGVPIKLVCIGCGKEKWTTYNSALPRPNTGQKIIKGSLGPQPGTWLGCNLGNHDYYFEHEVEK